MRCNAPKDWGWEENRAGHGECFAKRVSVSQAEPPPREAIVTNGTAILRGSLHPTGY